MIRHCAVAAVLVGRCHGDGKRYFSSSGSVTWAGIASCIDATGLSGDRRSRAGTDGRNLSPPQAWAFESR